MFKVQNLKTNILKDLNFEIGRGEIAIFLGSSGVGKTTLLRALNHLEHSVEGHFFLDGTPIDLAQASLAVGLIFQHFNLFNHLSVEENITLALTLLKGKRRDEAGALATSLLNRFGIHEKAKSFPHQLSGGQQQRVAIARTIALDPKIICFDEPTSALDPLLTALVASYLQELADEKRIILLATHDRHLVKMLKGKLFLMQEGTIVEQASTAAYEAAPGDYPLLHTFLREV